MKRAIKGHFSKAAMSLVGKFHRVGIAVGVGGFFLSNCQFYKHKTPHCGRPMQGFEIVAGLGLEIKTRRYAVRGG